MLFPIFEDKNLARWDRAARLILGGVLISQLWLGWWSAWGWLGILSVL